MYASIQRTNAVLEKLSARWERLWQLIRTSSPIIDWRAKSTISAAGWAFAAELARSCSERLRQRLFKGRTVCCVDARWQSIIVRLLREQRYRRRRRHGVIRPDHTGRRQHAPKRTNREAKRQQRQWFDAPSVHGSPRAQSVAETSVTPVIMSPRRLGKILTSELIASSCSRPKSSEH